MLNGIFSPITTPFTNDEIAFDKLEDNLSKWNITELSGYIVAGSNGESPFLTSKEKTKLTEFVKKNSNGKAVITGTGSDSIKETITATNEAASAGADAALVITPCFFKNKMNQLALKEYFTRVAEGIKIPLIIYNVPKFTGINVEPETVIELSKNENIIGIKHSTENIPEISEIISGVEPGFSVLVGTASLLYAGFTIGAAGAIAALANIFPDACVKIFDLVNKKEYDKAKEIQMQLTKINRLVTAKYGIAGLKTAMDMLNLFGGKTRSPLQDIDEKAKNEIREVLTKIT
jgi:4-hydroxy-2-oxoglutarate aldolase